MEKSNLKVILIQTGFNIERMKEDRAVNEKAYLVLKTRNEIALSELEACEGKDISTSEKDLRVCEVIASAWISVKERTPIENEKVLCFNGHRICENSWMQYTDQDEEWFKERFTHWMPRPILPED